MRIIFLCTRVIIYEKNEETTVSEVVSSKAIHPLEADVTINEV